MESYTALELAIIKATAKKCLLFYQEYEDHYGNVSYDDFTFYSFVSKEDFLDKFKFFCKKKSDDGTLRELEFCDCKKDEMYMKLDVWKNIYIKNYDGNVDLSTYEDDIML